MNRYFYEILCERKRWEREREKERKGERWFEEYVEKAVAIASRFGEIVPGSILIVKERTGDQTAYKYARCHCVVDGRYAIVSYDPIERDCQLIAVSCKSLQIVNTALCASLDDLSAVQSDIVTDPLSPLIQSLKGKGAEMLFSFFETRVSKPAALHRTKEIFDSLTVRDSFPELNISYSPIIAECAGEINTISREIRRIYLEGKTDRGERSENAGYDVLFRIESHTKEEIRAFVQNLSTLNRARYNVPSSWTFSMSPVTTPPISSGSRNPTFFLSDMDQCVPVTPPRVYIDIQTCKRIQGLISRIQDHVIGHLTDFRHMFKEVLKSFENRYALTPDL